MPCLVTQSCLTLCDPTDCSSPGSSVHGDSPGKDTGVGCHSLLWGSSQPRHQTQVSGIAGRFFTVRTTRVIHNTNSAPSLPISLNPRQIPCTAFSRQGASWVPITNFYTKAQILYFSALLILLGVVCCI